MNPGDGAPLEGGSPPLILASASPRRRQVLAQLGLEFEVRPAPEEVEEPWDGREAPAEFACRLAATKAKAVAAARPEALVLAADTIVVLDAEVLGKPAGESGAREMLVRLAGREHTVFTGVAAAAPGGGSAGGAIAVGVESTDVRFRPLDRVEIAAYVATGEPLDKAGAYGIQGYGAALVEGINGCYFNVMGLPIRRALAALEDVGWRYAFPGRLEAAGEPPG
ncbi:MAG TPA: Maf family protein [Gemmatimonadota bacterium]|nr:Maf family protein [Gemmatimonadota bacterium]